MKSFRIHVVLWALYASICGGAGYGLERLAPDMPREARYALAVSWPFWFPGAVAFRIVKGW